MANAPAPHGSLQAHLDNGPITPMMVMVVFIAFLLNLVDGFDVVAMSVTGAPMKADWGVTNDIYKYVLSSALVGMAIGAAVIAPLADKYGRRLLVILATVIIGVSMIAVAAIPRGDNAVAYLMALRFISGLGIGVIFASGSAIAAEFVPSKYRSLAVSLALLGYPTGCMLVGPIFQIIEGFHPTLTNIWQLLFVYCGIATLAVGALVYCLLPASPEYITARAHLDKNALTRLNRSLKRLGRARLDALPEGVTTRHKANVYSLLAPKFRMQTLGLWTIYFMALFAIYFLLTWTPVLFVDNGYTRKQGIDALFYFNFGALFGMIGIGCLSIRQNLAAPISIYYFIAGGLLATLFFWRPEAPDAFYVMMFGIGVFLQGAFSACYALAAKIYPADIRTTGIGWAAGLGRTGAIISPIAIGLLKDTLNWDFYSLFMVAAIPLLIAAALTIRYRH